MNYLFSIEHFNLEAYTIYTICQLTYFRVADVTIPQVLHPALSRAMKHPHAGYEDAILPAHLFPSNQINSVLVSMYCSSIQLSLPFRYEINTVYLMGGETQSSAYHSLVVNLPSLGICN